jgi:nucleoside-diphosphate-sugar epimerase
MSKGKVVVLGVNGHVGSFTARAFVEAGWDVTGMARTDKHGLRGVRFVKGDAESVEDMRRAIGDVDVVVNALNLPYDTWDKGRKEAQMARVLEAMGTSGKTMLFPGNIYNYSASDREVTPELPQRPETPRGAIRVRVEEMFQAAAGRGDIQLIVLRAGDFFAPEHGNGWFDLAMMSGAKKGRVGLLGRPGVGHSWAYLPDMARAFEALASLRSTLGASENFHFAGHYVTPEQMAQAIAKAVPMPVSFYPLPTGLHRALALFVPVLREVLKMGYLWNNPMRLRDDRLEGLLGPGFGTPFDVAVAATVAQFYPPVETHALSEPKMNASLTRA